MYDSCTPTTSSSADLFGERLKENKEIRARENADRGFWSGCSSSFQLCSFEEICFNIFKSAKPSIIHETNTKLYGFFQ